MERYGRGGRGGKGVGSEGSKGSKVGSRKVGGPSKASRVSFWKGEGGEGDSKAPEVATPLTHSSEDFLEEKRRRMRDGGGA